jgi:hypothetical protein
MIYIILMPKIIANTWVPWLMERPCPSSKSILTTGTLASATHLQADYNNDYTQSSDIRPKRTLTRKVASAR